MPAALHGCLKKVVGAAAGFFFLSVDFYSTIVSELKIRHSHQTHTTHSITYTQHIHTLRLCVLFYIDDEEGHSSGSVVAPHAVQDGSVSGAQMHKGNSGHPSQDQRLKEIL
jgi:hypothetical protein